MRKRLRITIIKERKKTARYWKTKSFSLKPSALFAWIPWIFLCEKNQTALAVKKPNEKCPDKQQAKRIKRSYG